MEINVQIQELMLDKNYFDQSSKILEEQKN